MRRIISSACLALILLGLFSLPCHAQRPRDSAAFGDFRATNPRDGSVMLLVPGGRYRMGSTRGAAFEAPPHLVRVQPFFLSRTEVTNAQFQRFVSATGYKTQAEQRGSSLAWNGRDFVTMQGADWRHPNGPGSGADPEAPVVHVTWYDANQYATWAGMRLPTEQEWEFAARGYDGRIWPWGNDFHNDYARTSAGSTPGSAGRPTPVGAYPRGVSPYGMMDMVGNVWEWTSSVAERYPGNNDKVKDFYGAQYRILRGGSWYSNDAWKLTTSFRTRDLPGISTGHFGFRVARDGP